MCACIISPYGLADANLQVATQCVATINTSSWSHGLSAKHLATGLLPSPDQGSGTVCHWQSEIQ